MVTTFVAFVVTTSTTSTTTTTTTSEFHFSSQADILAEVTEKSKIGYCPGDDIISQNRYLKASPVPPPAFGQRHQDENLPH